MALKKVTNPVSNPADLTLVYPGDWNDLIDALTGVNPENLRFVSEGGNDLNLQDAGGNVTLNPANAKVLAIGNLSGDRIDNYLPLLQKSAAAYIALYPTGKLFLDGGGDTWFYESAANKVESVAGGAAGWINDAGVFKFAKLDKAGDPTASDLQAGFAMISKNTSSGAVKLWYNDGGTLKSVALS